MIYTVTFANLGSSQAVPTYYNDNMYNTHKQYEYLRNLRPYIGQTFDYKKVAAEVIKESTEDSFVFIITNKQMEEFTKWIKENKLEEYEVYRMARPITNGNHTHNGRNLLLVVFASKQHVWRDMFEIEMECV